MLYKTNLCKFYAKGTCKRGAKCSWAHGDTDVRPFPAFFKTRMCYNWIYFGTCERDPCTYAHSQVELRGSGKALRLCNYYFREGSCPKGTRCPMAHDVAQLDPSIRNHAEMLKGENFAEAFAAEALAAREAGSPKKGKELAPPASGQTASAGAPMGKLLENQQELQFVMGMDKNGESSISPNLLEWLGGCEASASSRGSGSATLYQQNRPPTYCDDSHCDDSPSRADPVDELWALLKQAGSEGAGSNTGAISNLPADICGGPYDPAFESDTTHTPSSSEDSSFFNQPLSLDINTANSPWNDAFIDSPLWNFQQQCQMGANDSDDIMELAKLLRDRTVITPPSNSASPTNSNNNAAKPNPVIFHPQVASNAAKANQRCIAANGLKSS